MIAMFPFLLLVGVVAFFIYRLICLYRNYLSAKKIGLPIVVMPISWQDIPWLVGANFFRWIEHLPFCSWYRYSYMGWVLYEKHAPHARFGPAFTIVTPTKNEIVVGTPDLVGEIMGNYKKWHRPRQMYEVFALFGDGVVVVDGDDWQRQRRIVNHGFREQNHKLVWQCGIKQARQWCDGIVPIKTSTSNHHTLTMATVKTNMNTISSHVLMHAGFAREYDFNDSHLSDISPGHTWSFGGAMNFILNDIIFVWAASLLPRLPAMLEPANLKTYRTVQNELQRYFEETIQSRSGDFVQALVDANEKEKTAKSRQHLSDKELYGNMFALNIAGFDTVAYTMLWAVGLLAANPDIQAWVREEVDNNTSILTEYETGFVGAVRCRAIMLETLRVYGIAPNLARVSPHDAQTLRISDDHEIVVPAGTYISVNFPAAHSDPAIWGAEDAVRWTPKRWIKQVPTGLSAGMKEELRTDPPMMAWAWGPRICPGRKFSQVEFCAVISTLLSQYILEGSSGLQEALDDAGFGLTPKLKRPESVSVKFVKR